MPRFGQSPDQRGKQRRGLSSTGTEILSVSDSGGRGAGTEDECDGEDKSPKPPKAAQSRIMPPRSGCGMIGRDLYGNSGLRRTGPRRSMEQLSCPDKLKCHPKSRSIPFRASLLARASAPGGAAMRKMTETGRKTPGIILSPIFVLLRGSITCNSLYLLNFCLRANLYARYVDFPSRD